MAKTARPRNSKTPNVILPNSLNKCILILRSKYDGLIKDSEGKTINLYNLKPSDLYTYTKDSKSLEIFRGLMEIKKIDKKPINKNLLYSLLGINSDTLLDKVQVTKTIERLLASDGNHERALYLLKLSDRNNVVAMNKIMEWLLHKNEVKTCMKVFNDRKKWGIEPNNQTYVILFDGISKAVEWGKLSEDLANTLISIFKKIQEPQTSQFNALLACLVKSFKEEQALAWEVFNLVPELECKPDAQTFTIFLTGLKKYNELQVSLVKDSKHKKSVKILKYYALHNELVDSANLIMHKMVTLASPPTAPSKEEIEQDINVLKKYLSETKNMQLIDVDAHFVTTYLSCLITNFSNTGDDTQMSNYNYVSKALKLLSSWSHDVKTMFEALSINCEAPRSLKSATDYRLQVAKTESAKHLKQPGALIKKSTVVEIDFENPLVAYPPSAKIKNKKRSVINAKPHPLIDVKLNKFLTMVLIDGLVQLDRPQQFLSLIWYYMENMGLEFKKYPLLRDLTFELEPTSEEPSLVEDSFMDILLMENFIYKTNRVFLKRGTSSAINLTILKLMQKSPIKPREKTYTLAFQIIEEEVEHYLKSNYNQTKSAQLENPAVRHTTRKPLHEEQLVYISTNLWQLMDLIPQKTSTILYHYNKLVSRTLNSGWLDFLELEQLLLIYKNILKSGIKLYYEDEAIRNSLNRVMDVVIKDTPDPKLKKLCVNVKKQYVPKSSDPSSESNAHTENLNRLFNHL